MTRTTGFGLLLIASALLWGCPGDDPEGGSAEGMGSSNAPDGDGQAAAGAAGPAGAGGDGASGAGSGGSGGADPDPGGGSVPGGIEGSSGGGGSDPGSGGASGTDPGSEPTPGGTQGETDSGGGDAGAGGGSADAGGGSADAGAGDAEPGGETFWFQTCGAPVCQVPDPGTGAQPCTDETAGAACESEGAQCDNGAGCGSVLVCASSDPRLGGCPISRARYKRDIAYLDRAEIDRVARELLEMRLATWRYRDDASGREHLGFIIDDVEPSASVRGDVVDLYGYTSMAVAALQRQAVEIEVLERELEALRGYVLSGRVCE